MIQDLIKTRNKKGVYKILKYKIRLEVQLRWLWLQNLEMTPYFQEESDLDLLELFLSFF